MEKLSEGMSLWVFITVKRHLDHGNACKGTQLIGADLYFRGLAYCHHGSKHGGTQPCLVLER